MLTLCTLHRGSANGLTENTAACRASRATEDQRVLPGAVSAPLCLVPDFNRARVPGAIPIHPIISAVVWCHCCNLAYKPPQWKSKSQWSKSFLWTDLCCVCGARVSWIINYILFPVCRFLSTMLAPVCPLTLFFFHSGILSQGPSSSQYARVPCQPIYQDALI